MCDAARLQCAYDQRGVQEVNALRMGVRHAISGRLRQLWHHLRTKQFNRFHNFAMGWSARMRMAQAHHDVMRAERLVV